METVVRVPILRGVYTNTFVRRKVDGIFFAVRDCLVELSSFPDRENLLTRRMNVWSVLPTELVFTLHWRRSATIMEELRVGDNPSPITEQCPPIIFFRETLLGLRLEVFLRFYTF